MRFYYLCAALFLLTFIFMPPLMQKAIPLAGNPYFWLLYGHNFTTMMPDGDLTFYRGNFLVNIILAAATIVAYRMKKRRDDLRLMGRL